MKAIGMVAGRKSAGREVASLFINHEWEDFILTNSIPKNYPDFGVFAFNPDDRSCQWIDPNN